MQYNYNLTYGGISQYASTVPEDEYVDLYYFVLKSTPGVFRIHPPKKCRVRIDKKHYRQVLEFNYLTKAGNWSSVKSYYTKNNAYYYKTLEEAEKGFKKEIEFAKELFTSQIDSAKIALSELDRY